MPAWIECRECGVEFRDKPGRTKCPECGTRIADDRDDRHEDEEEWDDERPRKTSKGKGSGNAVLFALIGVGVLAVGLVVVLILLLTGGPKRDPSKVTVANFQKLNAGMTQAEAEKILAGSSSSSVSDLQSELGKAGSGFQGQMLEGVMTMFSGPGEWRRWDGVNGDVKAWGLFTEPLGGGKERLSYSFALEKLPGGGYRPHRGQQTLGIPGLGGFPFPQPGVPPFPGGQPFPQFPPFPK